MTIRQLILARGVGLLALAFVILGCQQGKPTAPELPPPPVSVSRPLVRDVIDYDQYEGRVAAIQKVELRTKARGYLLKVAYKDGDVVEGGKLLFQIDPATYEATLEAVEAQERAADSNLKLAESEFARVRKLVMDRAASREELEVWTAKALVARADKDKARAAIKQAKIDLDHTRVKAPFTGRVSRTQVNEGTLINAGGGDTLLSTIVSVGPVYVYFNVDERAVLRYRRDYARTVNNGKEPNGKAPPIAELKIPVHVALEGEEGYPHHGLVEYADPKLDGGTGTLEVRGRLDNPTGLLQDGMRARIRVPRTLEGKPYKATQITERAIGNEQGRKFVYVVNKDNVVERRDLVLDRLIDGLMVVRSGLKPDDRVVVSGIQRVREGVTVKPNDVPMPDAPAEPKAGK